MAELKTGTDLIPAASQEGDLVKATIRGEINLHNSPKLRKALLEVLLATNPRRLVLDLSLVPYMDSMPWPCWWKLFSGCAKTKAGFSCSVPNNAYAGFWKSPAWIRSFPSSTTNRKPT